jgi:hypothetical protein
MGVIMNTDEIREMDYQKIVDDGLKKIGEYNSQFFRKDDEGDE